MIGVILALGGVCSENGGTFVAFGQAPCVRVRFQTAEHHHAAQYAAHVPSKCKVER